MPASRSEPIPRTMRRRRAHWLSAMATGSVGLVTLIALLLPVTAAVSPLTVVQTIRITAPYTGATTYVMSSVYKNGCSTSTIVTPPFFHWRTGVAGYSGTASSHTCATNSSGSASTFESIYTVIPLVVLPGTDHITLSWSIQVDGGNSLHVGRCSVPSGNNSFFYCSATASVSVGVLADVFDGTNGSVFFPSGNGSWMGVTSATSDFEVCNSGNCSMSTSGAPGTFSFHGPAVWHIKAPGLVTSHTYYLSFGFYSYEFVSEGGYQATISHSGGNAWLNFGTFGDGAMLHSILIT
ncbi:MAG: hypothetical protein L3K18_05535 [Thermoplasmata archaeon]|nr:hypothetical protein [Thermoplasmata archaeon]MCI4356588.1 hypothetical protein [Thermoplasmata archaeon]